MFKNGLKITLILSMFVNVGISFAGVDLTCLKYEPAVVTLVGVLKSKVYPGPPNFLSVDDGDEPETGYYLELKSPICTVTKQESWMLGHDRIASVQLAVSKQLFNQLGANVGRAVSVKGTLFEASDAHHHTPVLIDVQTFDGSDKAAAAQLASPALPTMVRPPVKPAAPISNVEANKKTVMAKKPEANKKAEVSKKSAKKPNKTAKSSKTSKSTKQKKAKK